jgi:hypothetical protein
MPTDNDQTETIQKRLIDATKELHRLAPLLGTAKQVIEFKDK